MWFRLSLTVLKTNWNKRESGGISSHNAVGDEQGREGMQGTRRRGFMEMATHPTVPSFNPLPSLSPSTRDKN